MGKAKKILVLLMAAVLVLTYALPALAEAISGALGIDWAQVVVWLIGVVATAFSALLARVWMAYVKPWLEQKGLMDAAGIVVNAVEALMGRYCGEDKWRLALEKMKERGFNVDSNAVIDALKAAWLQMNLEQIAVGVKDPPAQEMDA